MKTWIEEGITHFNYNEFDSPDEKDSGLRMNIEFIKVLELIRKDTNIPLIINSGYRSLKHNQEVGGKSESAHTTGNACDIRIDSSMDRFKIIKASLNRGIRRIGIAHTFIHLDLDFTLPQEVIWLYGN